MKQLTPEQIQDNWNELVQVIDDTFASKYEKRVSQIDTEDDERHTKLLEMYDYFEDRMCMAPASGKKHFHYAHSGGYVEHVLHVVKLAQKISDLLEEVGGTKDYTDEELVFAALHHDLGKIGDLEYDYYIPQDSDWHVKNRGEIFTHNPELAYMAVPDRALWLLQYFGLQCTVNETMGIKLADGLYDDANAKYFKSYIPDYQLRSNIGYVLHWADSMATRVEYDEWKRGEEEEDMIVRERVQEAIKEPKEKKKVDNELQQRSQDLFEELFGDK